MPVSIDIEPQSGLAIASCSGVFGRQEAQTAAVELWQIEEGARRCVVWDLGAADLVVSPADARELAAFVKQNQPMPPPEKVAFVVHREVDFGMARMFEVFREDPRTASRVFRARDEAVRWAGSPDPQDA